MLKRWIIGGVLALLLLLGGAAALAWLLEPELDLSGWQQTLAGEISAATGRAAQIEGGITLRLGRHLYVDMRDVRIANPDWAGSDPLLQAGRVAAGLDLLELFSGVLLIEDVVLQDVDILLAESASGERSWELAAASAPDAPEAKPERAWRIVLEEAVAGNVTLIYREPQATQPFTLQLDRLRQHMVDGMLQLDLSGQVGRGESYPLKTTGQIGPLQALLDYRDIRLDLQAMIAQTSLTLAGKLGAPEQLEHIDLAATLRGPSANRLLDALGVANEERGDVDLEISLTDQEQGFAWRSAGHLGGLHLESSGQLQFPLQLDGLELSFDVHGEDLHALGYLAGIEQLPVQPYRLQGGLRYHSPGLELRDIKVETGSNTLQITANLPAFPVPDGGSSRFELHVPEPRNFAELLGVDAGVLNPLQVTATLTGLESGGEQMDAELTMGSNRLTLSGPLGVHPDYDGTQLAFSLFAPDLHALGKSAGLAGLSGMSFDCSGQLAVQDHGTVRLRMDKGNAGAFEFGANGVLGRFPDFEAADLVIRMQGKSLHAAAAGLAGTALPRQPFELQGRLSGRLSNPVLGDIHARLGSAQYKLKGRVGMPPHYSATDARVELQVPKVAELFPDPPAAAWAQQAYQASGRLASRDGQLQLIDVAVTGDGVNAMLNAALPVAPAAPGPQLKLSVKVQDLASMLPELSGYHPPSGPFSADIRIAEGKGRIDIERLAVSLSSARLSGSGNVVPGDKGSVTNVNFTASGPQLSALGEIDGMRLPDADFKLDGRLQQSPQRLQFHDLQARIGSGTIGGKLDIRQGKHLNLELDARLQGVDLQAFMVPAEPEPEQAPAQGKATAVKQRVIPDTPVPTGLLDNWDASVRVTGTDLRYADPIFPEHNLVSELRLDALLKQGSLQLREADLSGDRGALSVSGELAHVEKDLVARLAVRASRLYLGLLAIGQSLTTLPAHEVEMNLAARGQTWQQLAAHLNGDLYFTGGKGRTTNAGLDKILGAFGNELLATVNPFSRKEPYSEVICSAAALDIVDGKVLLDPGFVTRTDKIDIAAMGSINLANEKLDVQFRSTARKGIGLSAASLVNPFIKVSGTLAAPRMGLDKSGTALVSGTAAVATGGATLLLQGLVERTKSSTVNPCEQLVANAAKKRR